MKSATQFMKTGQGVVEYALIVLLVALVIIVALQVQGITIAEVFCRVSDGITGGDTCRQTAVCSDSFSSDEGNWSTAKGDYDIRDDQLCLSGNAMIFNQCSEEMEPEDYVIIVEGATLFEGPGYGIYFRASNTTPDRYGYTYQNGYTFQYDPGYGGFVFEKWVRGNHIYPQLAKVRNREYDFYHQPREIKIVVKGNTFSAYVDDELVLTATDDAFPEGDVGLRSYGTTQVCMDNFRVEALP